MRAQQAEDRPVGLPTDWSHRHVVFTNSPVSADHGFKASQDPRAYHAFLRRLVAQQHAKKGGAQDRNKTTQMDWAFSMGAPNTSTPVATNQYPATWVSFIYNGGAPMPSCANDYLVIPLAIVGSPVAANLIGVNNLYSNSAAIATGGACGTTGPKVLFAYQNASANATSVSVSLDGKKIVWVENSNPPKLHVLAWKSDGATVALPDTPTVVASAPAAGSGTMTSLTLSSSTAVTNSAPFVDYDHDAVYTGDDSGHLYKAINVFCTTPACGGAQPSLDPAWGSNPVALGSGKLTPPVADFVTGNVYVGSSDGKLYGVNSSNGTSITGSPVTIGNGLTFGGINDAPIVDGNGNGTNSLIYTFTGDNGTNAVAAQTAVSLATHAFGATTTQPVGQNAAQQIHMGALNDAYYTGSGTAELYVCGNKSAGSNTAQFYNIGFGASKAFNVAPANFGNLPAGSGANNNCAPLTEFNDGAHDRLFVPLPSSLLLNDYVIDSVLTSTACPSGVVCFQQATNSVTSGIIVDNNLTGTTQADNIYIGMTASGNITGGSCWTTTGLAFAGAGAPSSRTTTTATVNTAANHGLAIGETVNIANASGGTTPGNMDGTCTVATTPSVTQFTCTYPAAGGTSSGVTGGNVQKGTCMFKLSQGGLT